MRRQDAVPLDPVHLPLQEGEFRFARMGGLPSAVRDASVDNWGRLLIERYYTAQGDTTPISEAQFLLSAPKDRAGNLHFATRFGSDGTPLWDEHALKPEELPSMAELKEHVIALLKDPVGRAGQPYPKQLDALLTGAGGARPKVNIATAKGRYLLKLAHPLKDQTSNARLEEASLRMAKLVGIEVAAAAARQDGNYDFLAVKRFDTTEDGSRVQMVSAMTVLNAADDPYNRTNWSYVRFAQELGRWSANPARDREQLFRSMVLRAMLSDADDHPRNYALLRDPAEFPQGGSTLGQWRLAPMYDCVVGMGIGHRASELAMTIGDFGYEITEENILSQCEAFGLTQERARDIMLEIQRAVMDKFSQVLAESMVDQVGLDYVRRSVVALDERAEDSPIQRLMKQADQAEDEQPSAGESATAAPARQTQG